MPGFDYVTVGHVTVDVILDRPRDTAAGRRQPGGGAFYSALQAARLGLRTLILTRGDPGEIEQLLAPYAGEVELRVQPAPSTTTLLTSFGGPGQPRRQRLLGWAGPIAPPRDLDAAILHLAPIARETPPSFGGAAELVGLTPQGLVRQWDADGEVVPAPLARELLPARLDAAVLSADELPACGELLPAAAGPAAAASEPGPAPSAGPAAAASEPGPAPSAGPAAAASEPGPTASAGPVVAVTHGAGPTALYLPGAPPLEVAVEAVAGLREDVGAGDVFAAAFFVALREGLDPEAAAGFANAAAAVRIAGAGPEAIGRREEVAARASASPR